MLRFRMHFQTLGATACGTERQCSVFRCIFCPLNGNAPFFEAFLRLVDVYLAVARVFFRRLGWVAMLRFIHQSCRCGSKVNFHVPSAHFIMLQCARMYSHTYNLNNKIRGSVMGKKIIIQIFSFAHLNRFFAFFIFTYFSKRLIIQPSASR